MFENTRHGFVMQFANGWTVSVQYGPGNYCSRRFSQSSGPSESAEVAVWDGNGDWFKELESPDGTCLGWQSAEQVLELMNKVAAFEPVPVKQTA